MLDGVRRSLAERAAGLLGVSDGAAFLGRFDVGLSDLCEALRGVYGPTADLPALVERFTTVALDAATARPATLRLRDRVREGDPAWFQRSGQVGYIAYVDRFAGSVAAVEKRLDYLAELGVTYLHLMPLLKPRPGENDGGYAVADYRQVDPQLGTMADLERLAGALQERGINLCLDFVLNHTAAEHVWAQRAVAGDPAYADRYLTFPDRELPAAFERTLPEVFPATAPGNFTWQEQAGRWVWTTFNTWQWDLDYRSPSTFAAMLDAMLHVANRGVDVLRLDAVPFTWKRLGTDCQNQPEAHQLLQAFRALVRMAAPAVIFKAEAIVPPEQLVQYLGGHTHFRPECDLAYHNQLMVLLWSCAASRDVRLAVRALERLGPPPPTTSWVTYLRCHDDIGWAVSDADANAVGLNPWAHRRFLADFYAGRFPGSFARGVDFQHNRENGDVRTSGSAAALCGIEQALDLDDAALLDAAVRRLILLYSVVFSYSGIPLIYMGDEIALRNDKAWRSDPETAGDNRWIHRPPMGWLAAESRADATTVAGRVFAAFRKMALVRRRVVALRGDADTTPYWTDNDRVLAYRRRHPRGGPLLALVNFDESEQSVDAGILTASEIPDPMTVHSSDGPLRMAEGRVRVPGLGFGWLVSADSVGSG